MKKPFFNLIFCVLLVSCGAQAQPQKAPLFRVKDIKGNTISMADLRGKVVMLDFWATWCPPCVMSFPEVEKLGSDFDKKDVVVLGFSLDQDESAVKEFIKDKPGDNAIAMVSETEIPSLYSVQGLPTFFIIDKNGYVVKSWTGYHPMLPSIWRKEIEKLLKN